MLDQWSQAASEAWDVGRVGRLTLSFEVVVFTIQANVVKCMEEKKVDQLGFPDCASSSQIKSKFSMLV